MPRRVLVVATAPDPNDELRERICRRAGADAEVLVIAPASDLSFLEWLTSDEDRARAEAERTARRTAETVQAEHAVVGDVDPLVAIEDALRTFPADELIFVTRPDHAVRWLERDALARAQEHFGLPVTHLVDDPAGLRAAGRPSETRREALAARIASGENPFTAFLAEFAVAVVVGAVAAILIAVAFTVYVSG